MKIYRARSSAIWGWTAIGVGILIAVVHVSSVGIARAQGGLGLGLAAAALGTAAFLRPHVAVSEDAVAIHNVLTTATMPFARLAHIETRWTLELVGDDGRKIGAFAAPAPGAAQSHRIRKDGRRTGDEAAAYGSPGDRVGTPSGDAAALVKDGWQAWRSAHPGASTAGDIPGAPDAGDTPDAGGADGGEVGASSSRTLDPVGVGLVVVALVAAAWGLVA